MQRLREIRPSSYWDAKSSRDRVARGHVPGFHDGTDENGIVGTGRRLFAQEGRCWRLVYENPIGHEEAAASSIVWRRALFTFEARFGSPANDRSPSMPESIQVVMATDGSEAAIDAARRSMDLLRPDAHVAVVMVIPEYEDPQEDAGGSKAP